MTIEIDAIDLKAHVRTMYQESDELMLESEKLKSRSLEIRSQANKLKVEFSSSFNLLNKEKTK